MFCVDTSKSSQGLCFAFLPLEKEVCCVSALYCRPMVRSGSNIVSVGALSQPGLILGEILKTAEQCGLDIHLFF